MAKKPDLTPRSGIIDLDTVVIGKISVRLNGETYSLPDQVPLGVALEIMQVFDQVNETEGEGSEPSSKREGKFLVSMFEKISKVFTLAGHEEVTPQFLMNSMTLQQGGMLLRELMSRLLAQQEEAGNP